MPFLPLATAVLATATLCAPALRAQSTLLTRQGGTIGQQLTWTVKAPKAWFFLPSLTTGPVPLAALDPSDPRSLAIGLDLIALSAVGPAGTHQLPIPIPNDPGFSGTRIRAQFFTLPGSTYLVDELSNPVSSLLHNGGSWYDAGRMLSVARALPTASELPDRRVLLAGGGTGSLISGSGLDSTEIYLRDEQRFVAGPKMLTARALHAAVTLQDGRVLLIGGVDGQGNALKSCEIYDPAQNRFVVTGALSSTRVLHAASILPDGRVLATGGVSTVADPVAAIGSIMTSTEIYNPATGSWSNGPGMRKARAAHRSAVLNDGRVLQVGGLSYNGTFIPLPGTTDECEIYVPASNSFVNTGKLPYSAGYTVLHPLQPAGGSATQLIAVGGINSGINVLAATPLNRTAIYDSATGSWTSVGNLPSARVAPSLAIAGGNLHALGGANGSVQTPTPMASCARFDLQSRSWVSTSPLTTARAGAVGISLSEGQLLIVGGGGGSSSVALDSGSFWFAP
jgi:hypothetical protein